MRLADDVPCRVPRDVHLAPLVGGNADAIHPRESLSDRALGLERGSGAAHARIPHRRGLRDAVLHRSRRVPRDVTPSLTADRNLSAANRADRQDGRRLTVNANGTRESRLTGPPPDVVQIAVRRIAAEVDQ